MDEMMGVIKIFAGNFAPRGWMLCQGQLLPISQYQALFSILGTAYGGDGRTTFALPDLRGRVPVGIGHGPGLSDYRQGEKGGVENVTLTEGQMPSHTHGVNVNSATGTTAVPVGNHLANTGTFDKEYHTATDGNKMNPDVIDRTGGGQSHENRQPFLGLHWIICMDGVFPSRS